MANVNCDKQQWLPFMRLHTLFVGLWNMKMRIIALILGSIFALSADAQRDHFLYLQTVDQQPFYIVYGGINYSSSAAGHLVLPKLADGTYSFQVGFPGKLKTTRFDVQVSGKDAGYVIEPQGENIQMKNLIRGNVVAAYKEPEAVAGAQDIVAVTVAVDATKDNSVQNEVAVNNVKQVEEKPVVSAVPPKKEVAEEPLLMDKKTMTLEEKLKALEAEEARMMAELNKGQGASKTTVATNKQEIETVSELSPERNPVAVATVIAETPKQDTKALVKQDAKAVPAATKTNSNANTGRTFLDMEMGNDSTEIVATHLILGPTATDTVKVVPQTTAKTEATGEKGNDSAKVAEGTIVVTDAKEVTAAKDAFVRRPCNSLLGKEDAAKLQELLASSEDEDEFIYQCRKLFKQQCVTTYQIKELSKQLKTDAVRYRLLDAAWPYTADYFNYGELRSLLKDDYYLTRFDAMIK